MSVKTAKDMDSAVANGERTAAPLRVDAAAIRELAALLSETGLAEIEIEHSGHRVRVMRENPTLADGRAVGERRTSASASLPPGSAGQTPAARQDGSAVGMIASPMVGTVYVAPEPGKPAFVKVGDTVKEGDTLLIVEAMKTMNPILAPKAGKVMEICVQDSQPVEFGQALIVLS